MASSSNSESQAIYDIFLSFRGPDTLTKFTDRLYETLKEKGYNPFRDREGVETGENIKSELRKAIEHSKISIIVFSEKYTTSTACLFEIQTIIEHREKNPDYVIVPVYYEVDPFEIKTQAQDLDKVTGVEVEVEGKKVMVADFEGKKVTVEMMKEWSTALMKVARLGGVVSGDLSKRYEAEFIAEIVAVLDKKQAGNYMDLNGKLLNLKRKVESLSGLENDINSEISSGERWLGKRPKTEVKVWLTHVQQCKDDVQRLEEKVHGETNVFPYICLGKDIDNKFLEVSKLQEQGKGFVTLLIDENPSGRLTHTLPKDFVKYTMARNTERIWECLINDDDREIGVYGMGGIGKTTIMKHLQNQLLEETDKLVYWVTVSQNSDIAKLQSNIAKAVNLNLEEDEEVTGRALRLHAHLSKQRSYILIFDDVWEPFHLDEVGIPEPTRSNGCKLVLTTRSLEACQKMDWKPIEVHLFTEEEAWSLFLTKAIGPGTLLAPDVQEIAHKISKECACLPLAIIIVAGSLRGLREIRDWRNALKELTSLTRHACDVTKVLERLQFSYNRLGDKVLRDCFLYCSLYPEDLAIKVDSLIKHWIAEGLISEKNSVEAQFDEGHAILKTLERRCLLESSMDVCMVKYATMHDLIRDMALKITRSSPRFLVQTGKRLESIPFEDWSEDLEKVSFMDSSIRELPDRPPVCPRLATLLLRRTHLLEIADCFFMNMPGLKVLDLSLTFIKSLPESISNLENLQAIILEHCHRLAYVPSLKRLKALKLFSLSHSMIEELPEGIEELVNLRKLDLVRNYKLGEIPSSNLSRLSKLQYLTILTMLGVSAEYLLCMRQLRVVVAQFQNLQQFNEYVKSQEFHGLENYSFSVGNYVEETIICGKEVYISSDAEAFGSGLDDLVLPANLGYLRLFECNHPKSLSAIPCMKDAKDLRRCVVEGCTGLESVFSSSIFSEDDQIVLRTVERLELRSLPRFRALFDEIPPPHNIFFNLELLYIYHCNAVKNIFPFQLLHKFPNLCYLAVRLCSDVEDIIVDKEEISDCDHHRDNRNIITLPKLKTLKLVSLPSLRSIYDGVMVCPSLEVVVVLACPMLTRLPFSLHVDSRQVTAPPALRHISARKQWWESLKWDDPLTKTILQPYFRVRDSDYEAQEWR